MPYKDKELGKEKKKEYYSKNKEKFKEYYSKQETKERIKLNDRNRRVKRKQEAVDLLGGVCLDCGKSYPLACYDFHHLDPNQKEFDPCSKLTSKKEKFLEELRKCVLLCANCHRVRHFDTSFSKE